MRPSGAERVLWIIAGVIAVAIIALVTWVKTTGG